MGVLYFGLDISLPSVLWMRRMLEGLGDDVSRVLCEYPPLESQRRRWNLTQIEDSRFEMLLWRALRKLRWVEHPPATRAARRAVARAMDDPAVDVALVHYMTLAVRYAEVWRRQQKPIFVHCHGYDVTWDLRLHEPPHPREHPPDYVDRVRALPSHLQFLANSHATAARLREVGIPEERIHVKYLGVEMPETPPEPRGDGQELNILYLGRLIDCKGPDLVIRAFHQACDQGLEGRLRIAGDGPLRQACEAARADSPHAERIELLGAVDGARGAELRAWASLFVAHNQLGPVSRQEEAFGVSVVEAMAEGLPVVSGRSGSLPEIVDHGVHGLLVEPGDVAAQAQAFLELAQDPERRMAMGRAGWERARERFSIEEEMTTLRGLLGLSTRSRLAESSDVPQGADP